MHESIESVLTGLVAHLWENPAWLEGRGHEGWIAIETASFFRSKHKAGVALETPCIVATGGGQETRYADAYVRYRSGTEDLPLHLFFEFKCIPSHAASWDQTLPKFAEDCEKLMKIDVEATREYWQRKEDSWCQRLGKLRTSIIEGRFIGIGALFVALENEREKAIKRMQDRMRGAAVILEQELSSKVNDEAPTLCLAYRVDLAPG